MFVPYPFEVRVAGCGWDPEGERARTGVGVLALRVHLALIPVAG